MFVQDNFKAVKKMRIAIIGAGWYGCHLALSLKEAGYDVTLYEKNEEIFSGISGNFGIRLHAGPHYPRSLKTRETCRRGFDAFKARYPDLVVPHEYSIYALGEKDADGKASKVDADQFRSVCHESKDCDEIDAKEHGYSGLISAFDIDEPSIMLGKPLRDAFKTYLGDAGINVICNVNISEIAKTSSGLSVRNKSSSAVYDRVINATSHQSLLPKDITFPFDMEAVYQPCLALVYEDLQAKSRPFSFIVMDGWFPCMMPVCDNERAESSTRKYILTHGKWTIMGSYASPTDARNILVEQLDDEFVERKIKRPSEDEMKRFWPSFSERFRYVGWKGEVLAKLKTKNEFRSAVTFEKDDVIHIIPGKVSNIFDVEKEVFKLIKREELVTSQGFVFVKGGVLCESAGEIAQKPGAGEPNTCNLQTFSELRKEPSERRYPSQPIRTTHSNFNFQLKSIAAILAGSAVLAVSILILPAAIGIGASAILGSASLCTIGYGAYSFFAQSMDETKSEVFEAESMALPLGLC